MNAPSIEISIVLAILQVGDTGAVGSTLSWCFGHACLVRPRERDSAFSSLLILRIQLGIEVGWWLQP